MPIPGWLYALGFIVGSFVAMKKAKDNIGHDAHLGGAIVGLADCRRAAPAGRRLQSGGSSCWCSVLAILLLIYLWLNPLFLSVPSFFDRPFRARNRRSSLPRHKQENLQVDAILEKIARSGLNSLTADERALLESSLRETAAAGRVQEAGVRPGNLIRIVNPLPRR